MLKKSINTSLLVLATLMLTTGSALAETAAGGGDGTVKVALVIAIGFGLALAAFGGALGQSRAATAALEGIARNPGAANKVLVPMIIALALIESLVIYSLVISFTLSGEKFISLIL